MYSELARVAAALTITSMHCLAACCDCALLSGCSSVVYNINIFLMGSTSPTPPLLQMCQYCVPAVQCMMPQALQPLHHQPPEIWLLWLHAFDQVQISCSVVQWPFQGAPGRPVVASVDVAGDKTLQVWSQAIESWELL